jgi:DNA-binding XRE family transcriptional regulator
MKKTKIEPRFEYTGLGFPVILLNVPMIEVRGIWTPNIDYNLLQKVVLCSLAHSPSPLTGNHIRFIRSWFNSTQAEFGKLFGVTHTAIVKWEKSKNLSAKIMISTEREIRMHIFDQLLKKAEDFRNAYRIIHEFNFEAEVEPVEVNSLKDLIAI